VAIIHDVHATGKTPFAMINLLELAGISPKDITAIVAAKFPAIVVGKCCVNRYLVAPTFTAC
jgi:adenine/guanine phosphoribosyltransferase-like PRPP-binding protein